MECYCDYEFVCGHLLCVYHWEISTRESIFFLKTHEESRNEIMNYLFKRTIVMEFLMTKIDVFILIFFNLEFVHTCTK
jgi:hypothetical protein